MAFTASKYVGHRGAVLCVDACARDGLLASGSEDKAVRLWDTRRGKSTQLFAAFTREVTAVRFGNEDAPVLWAGSGSRVHALDLRRPDIIVSEYAARSAPMDEDVNAIAVGAAGRVAACDDGGSLALWRHPGLDEDSGHFHKVHDNVATALGFLSDGRTLVSGGMDATVRCNSVEEDLGLRQQWESTIGAWSSEDAASGTSGSQLFNPPLVHDLSVSQGVIAAALGDSTIAVLDAANGATLHRFSAHTSAVVHCSFPLPMEADGEGTLVTAGNDGYLSLWAVGHAVESGEAGSTDAASAASGAAGPAPQEGAEPAVAGMTRAEKRRLQRQRKKAAKKRGKPAPGSSSPGLSHRGVSSVRHDKYVNMVATLPAEGAHARMWVADTGNDITDYLVR